MRKIKRFVHNLAKIITVRSVLQLIIILLGTLCCVSNGTSRERIVPLKINEYGDIINKEARGQDGSTIEHVLIYPKLCSHSDKHIARHGILITNPHAQANVIICHGFMCDKYDAGLLRLIFPHDIFNCFVFDFRAHGALNQGQSCTLGRDEKYDVIAAARFLRGYPALKNKPLFAYGFSMGAVAAIEAQAKDGKLFDAMILDCPFESSENLLKRSLDSIKFSLFGYEFSLPGRCLLRRYAFHPYIQSLVKTVLKAVAHFDSKSIDVQACPVMPVESVKKIVVPCFYILCKNDEKVSIAAIKSMYFNTASSFKLLWVTNGQRHFGSFFWNPEHYRDLIQKFAFSCMNDSAQKICRTEMIQDPEEDYCGLITSLDLITTTGRAVKSAGNR